MKKVIAILAVLVFVGGGFGWAHPGSEQADAAVKVEAPAIAALEAQILDSTVQIEMFDAGQVEGSIRQVRTSQGFGSVVQYGGQRFILTHNHWSIPTAELNRVEIRNRTGQTLLVLDDAAFSSLVRYQDSGTMLLAAPAELAEAEAAELGDSSAVQVGSTVWLATHDVEQGQRIKIETAWVQEIDANIAPARLYLRGQETAVTCGDSGGGVWANGKLVANLWTIKVAKQTWELGISLYRPTGSIVAAIQPLPGAAGISAADLMAETAVDGGFERGAPE